MSKYRILEASQETSCQAHWSHSVTQPNPVIVREPKRRDWFRPGATDVSTHWNHLMGLMKQIAGPHPEFLEVLGAGPKKIISKTFPGYLIPPMPGQAHTLITWLLPRLTSTCIPGSLEGTEDTSASWSVSKGGGWEEPDGPVLSATAVIWDGIWSTLLFPGPQLVSVTGGFTNCKLKCDTLKAVCLHCTHWANYLPRCKHFMWVDLLNLTAAFSNYFIDYVSLQ